MKRCPSCNGTYPDDAPDFCPAEGMRLVRVEESSVESASSRSEPMPPAADRRVAAEEITRTVEFEVERSVRPVEPIASQAGIKDPVAVTALAFGASAATMMLIVMTRDANLLYYLMLIVSILSVLFGTVALYLAITQPSRFGGVALAIAGLSVGVAGLAYLLMNRSW